MLCVIEIFLRCYFIVRVIFFLFLVCGIGCWVGWCFIFGYCFGGWGLFVFFGMVWLVFVDCMVEVKIEGYYCE